MIRGATYRGEDSEQDDDSAGAGSHIRERGRRRTGRGGAQGRQVSDEDEDSGSNVGGGGGGREGMLGWNRGGELPGSRYQGWRRGGGLPGTGDNDDGDDVDGGLGGELEEIRIPQGDEQDSGEQKSYVAENVPIGTREKDLFGAGMSKTSIRGDSSGRNVRDGGGRGKKMSGPALDGKGRADSAKTTVLTVRVRMMGLSPVVHVIL